MNKQEQGMAELKRVNFMATPEEIAVMDKNCEKLGLTSRSDYLRKVALAGIKPEIPKKERNELLTITGAEAFYIVEEADFYVQWDKEKYYLLKDKQEIYRTTPQGIVKVNRPYIEQEDDTNELIVYRSAIIPTLKPELLISTLELDALIILGFHSTGTVFHEKFLQPQVLKHPKLKGMTVLRIEKQESKMIHGYIEKNIYAKK